MCLAHPPRVRPGRGRRRRQAPPRGRRDPAGQDQPARVRVRDRPSRLRAVQQPARTSDGRRAARAAARAPPLPTAWCRSRWGPTPAGRSACPRPTAGRRAEAHVRPDQPARRVPAVLVARPRRADRPDRRRRGAAAARDGRRAPLRTWSRPRTCCAGCASGCRTSTSVPTSARGCAPRSTARWPTSSGPAPSWTGCPSRRSPWRTTRSSRSSGPRPRPSTRSGCGRARRTTRR